jgi:TolA-binding protein
MSPFEPDEAELDEAFERALIGAARNEIPSREASDAAWDRFAVALSGAAVLGGVAGAGAHGAKSAAAKAATRWAVIGAIGGSSVTAALLLSAPVHSAASPETSITASATAGVVASAVTNHVAPARMVPAEEVATAPLSVPGVAPPKAISTPRRARPVHSPRESSLAAEVSLLDAARTACSAGADDDALRLIDEYRSTFPSGELAADAEVVALDALVDKHDVSGAAVLGGRFLARHPNDPHAAHVRAVIESE